MTKRIILGALIVISQGVSVAWAGPFDSLMRRFAGPAVAMAAAQFVSGPNYSHASQAPHEPFSQQPRSGLPKFDLPFQKNQGGTGDASSKVNLGFLGSLEFAALDAHLSGPRLTFLLDDLFRQAWSSSEFAKAQVLLARGADPNYRSDPTQPSMVLRLARMEFPDEDEPQVAHLMASLIRHGAKVNDDREESALMAAVERKHKRLAHILLGAGANVRFRDRDGYTPLLMAALNSDKALVELLVIYDSDVAAVTPDGETALMLAAMHLDEDVVYTLGYLAKLKGVDVNAIDKHGETTLFKLCKGFNDTEDSPKYPARHLEYLERVNLDAIRYLLAHAADPNVTAEGSMTPLHRVLMSNRDSGTTWQIVKLLLENKAIVQGRDLRLVLNQLEGEMRVSTGENYSHLPIEVLANLLIAHVPLEVLKSFKADTPWQAEYVLEHVMHMEGRLSRLPD